MANLKLYKFDDRPWRRITSAVSKLNSSNVHVGLVGNAGARMHPGRDNLRVWEVALVNEYGTQDGHVPSRSFIRDTFADRKWLTSVTAQASQRVVLLGRSASDGLNFIGQVAANALRGTIERGVPPPNAPDTFINKGHGHTLIDSRIMIDAIGYQVSPASAINDDVQALDIGLDGE